MNQEQLYNKFQFECEILTGYRAVIQNVHDFTEDEAKTLIKESSDHFETQVAKLRDLKLQIEEFIWKQVKE